MNGDIDIQYGAAFLLSIDNIEKRYLDRLRKANPSQLSQRVRYRAAFDKRGAVSYIALQPHASSKAVHARGLATEWKLRIHSRDV